MSKDYLESALKELRLNKKGLAEELGITPATVYRWTAPPVYAIAYLRVSLQNRDLTNQLVDMVINK